MRYPGISLLPGDPTLFAHKAISYLKWLVDLDYRVKVLKARLAQVLAEIKRMSNDPLAQLSELDRQKTIEERRKARVVAATDLQSLRDATGARLRVSTVVDEGWRKKVDVHPDFLARVESKLGVTVAEAVDADDHSLATRIKYTAINLADAEIDRDFFVIVAKQRFVNAQKAYKEIENQNTDAWSGRFQALEDEARGLKGEIEYVRWARLERKKERVSKRMKQLRNGRLRL